MSISTDAPQEVLIYERLGTRMPKPIPRNPESNWQRILSSYQYPCDELDGELQDIRKSHQVPNAVGRDLELLGARYGELGKRRGRGYEVYRKYLLSLVAAFGGHGTRSDIQFALASGVIADEKDDIVLVDDPSSLTYTVEIRSHQPHALSLIDILADYADAPVVHRAGPIRYKSPDASVTVGSTESTEGGISASSGEVSVNINALESGTRINWEDGMGGFLFDDGHHFDVEEPSPDILNYVSLGDSKTVPEGLTQTAESPFEIYGDLKIDGNLIIQEQSPDDNPTFISYGASQSEASPVGIDNKLTVAGEFGASE